MSRDIVRLVVAALVAVATLDACARSSDTAAPPIGSEVEVLGVWQDVEAARFQKVLQRFERRTGVRATYTSTAGEDITAVLDGRLASGDPPDLAFVPQPGVLARYARSGQLVPIGDIVGESVRRYWSSEWRRLGSVDGRLFGLWFKAAHKSLVWYDIATFERIGVVPPSTPAAFEAVASAIVAAGTPAFALSGEDEWTLTDWFENLYLRMAGPDAYDALAVHRIPWTDPSVVATLDVMAQLVSAPVGVGGPDGIAATTFPESVRLVFGATPPAAAMVAEGDFVAGEITGSTPARLGIDADVFPFPDEDPSRRLVVGGGDAVVLLRDSPGARSLLTELSTPGAAEVWAREGGFVSPNEAVDLAVYPDAISRSIARSLIEAGAGFRFDLSDLQPADFGATAGRGMLGILGAFAAGAHSPTDTARLLETEAAAAFGEVTGAAPPGEPASPAPRYVDRVRRPRPSSSTSAGRSS